MVMQKKSSKLSAEQNKKGGSKATATYDHLYSSRLKYCVNTLVYVLVKKQLISRREM